MSKSLRRSLAFLCLATGSFVFVKLVRLSPPAASKSEPSVQIAVDDYVSEKSRLIAKYASDPESAALVQRVLEKYAQSAINLEKTDGLRGLKLLDLLDLEALYLYERYPKDFRRLCGLVDEKAAARILLTWRDYLGLKRADETDRALWIAELERLSPSRRALVEKYPELLPLMMSEPEAVASLVDRTESDPDDLRDSLIALQLVSLKEGPRSLRKIVDTLERHPKWALEALRQRGPEGLLLVSIFGDVIESLSNDSILNDSLIALHVSCEDSQIYLRDHSPQSLAAHLRHLSAVGLLTKVADHPNALRLTLDYGDRGEAAVRAAGADAAEIVYQVYSDSVLRRQAVESLADHGSQAALVLEKYAPDHQFREILRRDGSAVIPPIARSDMNPDLVARLRSKNERTVVESLALGVMSLSGDSGQAAIRMIYEDGLPRAAQVYDAELSAVEFLPLYDLTHLANVLAHGYAPTSGEWTWAMFDGAFVVADVLGLAALQPEAVAASEMTRGQIKNVAKAGAREAAESLGNRSVRAAVETGHQGASQAARRAGTWYSVRQAGGLSRVLSQLPRAMDKMGLEGIESFARPLARKAGLTLSRFEPLRFMKDGREVLMSIPRERGMKYLAVEGAQAGVGLAAFWKMEEHLASRRGDTEGSPSAR
ncbi:hypothetical protein GC170_05685 [bacterium]|nr:hypothetical protein [bacterium]